MTIREAHWIAYGRHHQLRYAVTLEAWDRGLLTAPRKTMNFLFGMFITSLYVDLMVTAREVSG